MEDKTNEALITENLELRKELNKRDQPELSYKFELLSDSNEPTKDKPMKIRGILIAEGIWKGTLYKYEEMKKTADKWKGKTGLVFHGHSMEFGDRKIGELSNVESNDTLRAILFEASVTDTEAQNMIKEGKLDSVSIKGEFRNFDTSGIPPVGLDYNPIDWSLTSSPACTFCNIFSYELSKSMSAESLNQPTNNNLVNEELNMSVNTINTSTPSTQPVVQPVTNVIPAAVVAPAPTVQVAAPTNNPVPAVVVNNPPTIQMPSTNAVPSPAVNTTPAPIVNSAPIVVQPAPTVTQTPASAPIVQPSSVVAPAPVIVPVVTQPVTTAQPTVTIDNKAALRQFIKEAKPVDVAELLLMSEKKRKAEEEI